MKHKKNTRKNKSHKGRKILLSQSDIKNYVDQAKRKKDKLKYGSVKDVFSNSLGGMLCIM